MTRPFLHFACLGLGAALLLAPSGAAFAQAQQPWRHGILAAKDDSGFLFMAANRGFAEREGLKLELLQVKDDQVGLKALLAGELESYEGGVQGAIVAAVRGADVKIIGCHWLVVPHGIFVRAGINSIEDLRDKNIAVSAPGTFPEMLARATLAKYNIPADAVKFASVGSDRDRFAALVGGVVDAAVVSNEVQPMAEAKGIRLLVAGAEAVPQFVRICQFSTSKVLSERRDDAVRYLTAEMKALHYALSHRDETIALTREITGEKPDDPRPAFVYDNAVKTNAIDPTLPIPMDRLAWMQNQLVEAGKLPRAGDLSKAVDPSIRATALAAIERGH
jgi:NitT/TauT family transport system substrate-binding protein